MAKARRPDRRERDRAWRALVARLHDTDDVDAAVAACAELDALADETWVRRLRRLLLEGRDFFVREAAAWPLARLEGVRALPALLEALALGHAEGHDNDGLATIVVEVVEGDPAGAAPLLRRLVRSRRAADRADGAWLWAFGRAALDAAPLLRLARDRSPRVRSAAVGSLASFVDEAAAFEAVLAAAHDRSPDVRVSAALGLRGVRSPTARRALARLRDHDPEPRVREYVRALAAWPAG
ncbi:MAG: HEAT repeat domain-containing protein [Planctomycetes bacterium]|nr:HEAT repeat domain-containing protein [Planctomycetota bacterium]